MTHRAVAARAGVPLASTTYYFRSGDDLLEQAVLRATLMWSDAARSAAEALPARLDTAPQLAAAVLSLVTAGSEGGEGLTTMYERYLEAGRRPSLRAAVTATNDELTVLVAGLLERADRPVELARVVLAVADGLLLAALAEGRPHPASSVLPELTRMVGLLPAP